MIHLVGHVVQNQPDGRTNRPGNTNPTPVTRYLLLSWHHECQSEWHLFWVKPSKGAFVWAQNTVGRDRRIRAHGGGEEERRSVEERGHCARPASDGPQWQNVCIVWVRKAGRMEPYII